MKRPATWITVRTLAVACALGAGTPLTILLALGTPTAAQTRLQTITATGGAACEQFGHGIAIDGTRVVVGAAAAADDPPLACASGPGAAYVFDRPVTAWIQSWRLTPSDGATGDEFGNSVAVWGDRVVVGAEQHSGAGGSKSGAAYVFERLGSTWVQVAKLEPHDAVSGQYFARSVAISGDWIVCGTRFDKTLGNQAGAAYTFLRDAAGNWTETQKLLASDGATKDLYGNSVAIDGTTLIVGAYMKDGPGGNKEGAAYVYELQGSAWVETQKLRPLIPVSPAEFGRSVSICGNEILVGARAEGGPGAAYVFARDGASWVQTARLVASDGQTGSQFGESVCIHDGHAIVGARLAYALRGAAYLYRRAGSSWVETAHLAPPSGAQCWFGYNVGMSAGFAVVGAPFDLSAAGSASVYSVAGAATPARETVRLGVPPNPAALLPGVTSGPVLGALWDPVIDHASFVPDSILDVLGLGLAPRNYWYPPAGTLLCDLSNGSAYYASPGVPFQVAVPNNPILVGAVRYAMGASFDPASNVFFTNAIDITIGTF